MKSKLTLSSLLLAGAALSVNAQPTLTAATSVPTAGLVSTFNENSTYAPGSAGANQTWDFSGQTFPNVSTVTYENCNGTNNCGAFPGTTIVASQGGSYIYYKTDANTYSLNGVSSGGDNIPYNNAQDIFRFPCTFGSSYIDTWATTITSSGMTFYRTGIDSTTADGWGTLKTPAGTFTNTLRVKRISTFQDSVSLSGVPFIIHYRTVLYTWNDDTHKDFLFSASSLTNDVDPTPSESSIYTTQQGGGTGIASVSPKIDWNFAPNPAHDQVTVSINLDKQTKIGISITDMTGRVLHQQNNAIAYNAGIQQIIVPTSDIPAGIYLLKLQTENGTATSKLVIR